MQIGGFDWNLVFTWHSIPEELYSKLKPNDPVQSPTMAGGLFAIGNYFYTTSFNHVTSGRDIFKADYASKHANFVQIGSILIIWAPTMMEWISGEVKTWRFLFESGCAADRWSSILALTWATFSGIMSNTFLKYHRLHYGPE